MGILTVPNKHFENKPLVNCHITQTWKIQYNKRPHWQVIAFEKRGSEHKAVQNNFFRTSPTRLRDVTIAAKHKYLIWIVFLFAQVHRIKKKESNCTMCYESINLSHNKPSNTHVFIKIWKASFARTKLIFNC